MEAEQTSFHAVSQSHLEEENRVESAIENMSKYLSRSSNFGEGMAMQEDVIRRISSKAFDASLNANSATPKKVGALPSPDPFSENFDLVTYMKVRNAANASHGLDNPSITVTYEDLEIFGDKAVRRHIPNDLNVFVPEALKHTTVDTNEDGGEYRKLLSKTSGYFKPGEMTLVLGRPGAGCSTFLREIAGCSRGLTGVNGSVRYNDLSQKEIREKFASYVVYNPEDDAHYPTLTVSETLRFALECRIGCDSVTLGKTRAELIEERMEVILKMLGLTNCRNTNVGDENVRGCSGGERKRVSLAEMWCLGVSVGIWDGSTKGLDSSTALDFIRALRVMTDIGNASQIVSIYQASEEVYDLFDKVILLQDGKVVYSGPAKSTPKDYFKQLGFIPRNRSTTPDFLTGLSDAMERLIDPARSSTLPTPPNTASEFEQAYLNSQTYKDVLVELAEIRKTQVEKKSAEKFHQCVADIKRKDGQDSLIGSPYFTTLGQQFKATCKREITLTIRDLATVSIVIFDSFMALIVGGLFFQLKETPNGMVLRGGVLFFAVIYMCFNCIASVPLIIRGRAISGKHKTSMMYRTHLQVFATQMTNAPAMIVLSIVYSAINYWMVGLNPNGGAFITFMVVLFIANQAFGSIVRLVGTVMPDLASAVTANASILLLAILSMGYVYPYSTMHTWFKIVFWINPLQYALRALMQNEYNNYVISCENYSIPYPVGSTLDNVYQTVGQENKACYITASELGQEFVSGKHYIGSVFGFDMYNLYWNVLILCAYVAVFYYAMMYVSKHFGARPSEYSVNVWKHAIKLSEAQKTRQLEIANAASNANSAPSSNQSPNSSTTALTGAAAVYAFKPIDTSFTWKHINYTVVIPATGEKRQLLNDVQGYVKSGEMVALMGSSGAGKTTLMDCITQRKTTGDLNGQIYMKKDAQGTDFKSKTAYCEQMDVHNAFSTVRETIRFAARLRQPADIPVEDREAYGDYIMYLLELDDVADAMVGRKGSREGISLEQQKRLTIACELASKPEILFLDEPTSGLDSQAAFTIIRLLRKLTDLGQAVLCTIHQPSAVVFDHFDKVLLLAKGGQTVYFGNLGHNCETMIEYFTSHGADNCPSDANPAEWMLEVIGAGISTNAEDTFKRNELGELMDTKWWVKTWAATDNNAKISKFINELRGAEDEKATPIPGVGQFTPEFATPLIEQIYVVMTRMIKTYWRNPLYIVGRWFNTMWGAAWIGFAFFNTDMTMAGINNKFFALFTVITICNLLAKIAQPNFHEMRTVFIRERSTGVYDWKAFALSVILCEVPFVVINAICFWAVFYFPSGMSVELGRMFYFLGIFCLQSCIASAFGQATMSFVPAVQMASSINPFFQAIQLLCSGIQVPYSEMFWIYKVIYRINPYRYFSEAILANEIRGRDVVCDVATGSPFMSPEGMTCGEYFSPFMETSGFAGKLADPNAIGLCHYCTLANGDQVLEAWSWVPDHLLRNFIILLAFWVGFSLVASYKIWTFKAGR